MRILILSLFIFLLIISVKSAFADTAANADFDPFPQMEQDLKNSNNELPAVNPDQNDEWPPAVSNGQGKSEDHYE